MDPRSSQSAPTLDGDFVDKVIAANGDRPGGLLAILAKVQDHHPNRYLPRETLRLIAEKTGTPLSRLYSVATFYALFSLEPQGKNTICICRGTACHTRGSRHLLETVMVGLGMGADDESRGEALASTTADGQTTVRTVACFGQCALAPVVEVNHAIFGHMNEQTLQRELDQLKRQEMRK